jgi:uncharacterized DUF497 family protein
MLVEWDPKKAASNFRKHRARFADSMAVLEDERAITLHDFEAEEERWFPSARMLSGEFSWWSTLCGHSEFGSFRHDARLARNVLSMRRSHEEGL